MSFIAPWWLIGLVPWTAVVIWLLWGRRPRVDVPFLQLWKGPVEPPKDRRAFQAPPFWLGAAMVAMLLGILGAARPVVRISAPLSGPSISIIVDRGITMSARGKTAERYRELCERSSREILSAFGSGPVELVTAPGTDSQHSNRSDWIGFVDQMPPTAIDTREAVRSAVAQRLSAGDGPVIVLTDHVLDIGDPRLVRIAPDSAPSNVGIVQFAVREEPAAQAMVKIRNDSGRRRANLRITSDGKQIAQGQITLPPAGQESDYFFDLSAAEFGRIIGAQIEVQDDLSADNAAWIVRQTFPSLENRTPLPEEIRRMMDVYAHKYPPAEGSKHVSVASGIEGLGINEAGAAIVLTSGSPTTRPAAGLQVTAHPITRQIGDWSALLSGGATRPPAEGGWTNIVSAGDEVLVAIRNTPVRQVWTVHNQRWATTPLFVIFWTNVFNWLSEGAEPRAAGQLGREWKLVESVSAPKEIENGLWPGVYEKGGGAMVAVNAAAPLIERAPAGDWRAQLAKVAREYAPQARGRSISSILLLLALGALAVAAGTWKPGRRDQATAAPGTPSPRYSGERAG